MRIILSPSKTQNHQCRSYPHWTLPPFLDKSKLLVEKLRSYDVKGLATLMKMSKKLALLNWHRFQDFQFPPHEKIAHQALLTFQGDVFNPIACDTYTDADFLFAQDHIRILSGLYGVLRPLDLIQPYRLEMATKLSSSKQDSLYHFWGRELTQHFKDDLSNSHSPTLINLASTEYAKVIFKKELQTQWLDITFRQKKGQDYKVIAIHAKRARGRMVNFIIKNKIDDPRDLESFSEDGYKFKQDLSSKEHLYFHRDEPSEKYISLK